MPCLYNNNIMPLILYSYLTAEILAPFFASLIVINGVLFTGRVMQLIDLIFTMNISLADFIRLCVFISPKLLLFSIPMASSIAVIIAFIRLVNDNEIIALKAAGVSLYKMLPPVIVFAACTALATGFIATKFIPSGSVAMHNLFLKLATDKISNGVQAKHFSDDTGDIVIYVNKINQATGKWQGVYLSDLRDSEHPITIVAANGSLISHMEDMYISMDLHNGSLHREDGSISQTVTFKDYKINLPVQVPKSIGRQNLSKSSMTQEDLLRAAARSGAGSGKGAHFLSEYHKRLALPAGCFILTLLGLALALRGRPGQRNMAMPLGIGFFLLYFISLTMAENLSASAGIPVGLTMWLPNIIFGAITIAIMRSTAAA
ncbi:MAG: YjgP/YjgQ family permease [Deltaproteobacteria bacterium]|nr:YjgP/YjgQ family permease [Deltaproteobacteria bacterium]